MEQRFEELVCRYAENKLTQAEERELHSLLARSETLRKLFSQDRILDRLLRESRKPALNPDRILEALPRNSSDLTSSTMAAVAGQKKSAPTVSNGMVDRLRWFAASLFRPRFASCVLAVAAIVIVSFVILISRPGNVTVEIGRFTAVIGGPTVRHADGPARGTPAVSTPVYTGDTIETGDTGKAEIRFTDGTTIRLNFNTSVEIPKSARHAVAVRPAEITLRSGELWSNVQKLTNAPRFAVKTPVATATVKGTQFGLKVRKAKRQNASPSVSPVNPPIEAILTVKEGAVVFGNQFGRVEATALTETTVTLNTAPTQPVRLKLLKTFYLGNSRGLTIPADPAGFELYSSAIRLVYPQGWAGMNLLDVQSEQPPLRSHRIVRIWPNSPAESAGLAVGDLITHINGQAVTNVREALAPIWKRPNTLIHVTALRGDETLNVSFLTIAHPFALPQQIPIAAEQDVLDASWLLIEETLGDALKPADRERLEANLETTLTRHPGTAALYNNLGLWKEGADELTAAADQFSRAIQLEPTSALYHYNLGRLLRNVGNFDRATEEFETALQLSPNWVPATEQLALVYIVLARFEDAIALVDSGLKHDSRTADLIRVKALALLNQRKFDEALAVILTAAEREPLFYEVHLALCKIYWIRGEEALAEAAARKTIHLNPASAEGYSSLGGTFRVNGTLFPDPWKKPEPGHIVEVRQRDAQEKAILHEAETAYLRAMELKPSLSEAYEGLERIYLEGGQFDKAEAILHKLGEVDPDRERDGKNILAWCFAALSMRLDDALRLASEAVRDAPSDSGSYMDTLAVVHFRRGDLDAAEEALLKAVELSVGEPYLAAEIHLHLGMLYEHKNQIPSAIAAYKKALTFRSDYPEVIEALQKLGQ